MGAREHDTGIALVGLARKNTSRNGHPHARGAGARTLPSEWCCVGLAGLEPATSPL